MPRHQLVIAPAARADLKAIFEYGAKRWGRTRSRDYLTAIRDMFWLLTRQPRMGAERPELSAGVRSLPAGRHVIFYRLASDRIEIIRVLHGRRDPQRHLK